MVLENIVDSDKIFFKIINKSTKRYIPKDILNEIKNGTI